MQERTSEPRMYGPDEIREAVKAAFPHLTSSVAVAEQVIERLAQTSREEDIYETYGVYIDASGRYFEFFARDFCDEGDPPVWNEFGSMHTVAFDVPIRPLFRAGPVHQAEQDNSDLLGRLRDALGRYDTYGSNFGAYDFVGVVRDIVTGRV